MLRLHYTLMADGRSDIALMSVIDWVIADCWPEQAIDGSFAERLGPVGSTLARRIPEVLRSFPCDLLIVHRDAEGEPINRRLNEMARAMPLGPPRWVPLIPVKMTEAWLLSDEKAIRAAAENKRGTMELGLPAKSRWEHLADPKKVLFAALNAASGKSARARRKFDPGRQRALVAQNTADFSHLRGLSAFDSFEKKLTAALREIRHALD